jgi:hypothetical protein
MIQNISGWRFLLMRVARSFFRREALVLRLTKLKRSKKRALKRPTFGNDDHVRRAVARHLPRDIRRARRAHFSR